jgi:hypothetical protein
LLQRVIAKRSPFRGNIDPGQGVSAQLRDNHRQREWAAYDRNATASPGGPPLTAEPNRWVMTGADQPLAPADPATRKPGPDEVLVEIDACSFWSQNVGFAFAGAHGGEPAPTCMGRRIEGHVIEAGDNALFYADRSVVLPGTVPCGQSAACCLSGAPACPDKAPPGPDREAAGAKCVVAPAREISVAEKHRAHPLGPGLIPFNDG